MKRVAVLVLAAAALTACGLPEDDAPRLISADEAPLSLSNETPAADDLAPGEERASIYFLDAQSTTLVRVFHPVPASDDPQTELDHAIRALIEGLDTDDQAAQFGTAIPAGTTLNSVQLSGEGVAMIDLSSTDEGGGVLSVQGAEFLNLVAQFVYTATQISAVQSVLFSVDGSPLSVPTEQVGQVSTPVTRADYPSFAPDSS